MSIPAEPKNPGTQVTRWSTTSRAVHPSHGAGLSHAAGGTSLARSVKRPATRRKRSAVVEAEASRSSSRLNAICMPPSIPEATWPSRYSVVWCNTSVLSVVTPSCSVRVIVFTDSASGNPSNTSVDTMRSVGAISRYVPCQPSSLPSMSRAR